jgi:hypothetical protein
LFIGLEFISKFIRESFYSSSTEEQTRLPGSLQESGVVQNEEGGPHSFRRWLAAVPRRLRLVLKLEIDLVILDRDVPDHFEGKFELFVGFLADDHAMNVLPGFT